MSHHDEPDTVMHTDDQVARHLSRRTASVLVAVGLFLAGIATTGLFVVLINRVDANRHSNNLTRSEVTAIKALLAERKNQRDDENAAVQAQLDAQARVLCGVVNDFLAGARGPGQPVLAKAFADLHCAALAKTPPKSAPTASSSSSPRSSSAPAAATKPKPKPQPQPSGTSTTPPSQAGGPPPGLPTPPIPPLGLPLLTPVCNVIPLLC